MRHTQGPWIANLVYDGAFTVESGGVVLCGRNPWPERRDEMHANARLIAASPRLYEAVKRQVANIEHWLETGIPATPEESRSIYGQLKAALVAAGGKQ